MTGEGPAAAVAGKGSRFFHDRMDALSGIGRIVLLRVCVAVEAAHMALVAVSLHVVGRAFGHDHGGMGIKKLQGLVGELVLFRLGERSHPGAAALGTRGPCPVSILALGMNAPRASHGRLGKAFDVVRWHRPQVFSAIRGL